MVFTNYDLYIDTNGSGKDLRWFHMLSCHESLYEFSNAYSEQAASLEEIKFEKNDLANVFSGQWTNPIQLIFQIVNKLGFLIFLISKSIHLLL